MSQITLNIPERLDAYIATKLSEGYPSVESVILEAVQSAQIQEEEESNPLSKMTGDQRAMLERTLESRLDGPFVPMPNDLVERALSKATALAEQRRLAANA